MSGQPITNVEDAVAALGALPMPAGDVPQASPVVQSLALTEAQIEALVAAGDRVVNDEMHQHLCMCDAWPEKCVSTGNYYMGAWDVSGLEAALPAVLGLWESMRGGELERFRGLELGDTDGRVSAACGDPEHPTWLRAKDDTRRCPWCRIAELEAERHSTNEALDDAAKALREQRDRVAELERVIADAPASYVLMDRARAVADGITRTFAPTQALRAEDEFGLHHTYRTGRDLPKPDGVE